MASDAERLCTYEEDFPEAGLPLSARTSRQRAAYLKLRENQASG